MLARAALTGRTRAVLLLRPLRSLSLTTTTAASSPEAEHRTKLSGPPPIRVALSESAGRGVFAARPIAAGELIHTAKPLVAHPNPFLSHKVCYNCLRWLGRKALPGSDGTAESSCNFCSEECREISKVFYGVERKANWSHYDHHCRTRGFKYPLMVKRLACMIISGETASDSLDILQPASLLPETVLQMEEEFELLKQTFMKAQVEEDQMAFLTKQWYINVLARIRINAFRIELVARSYEDQLAAAAASVEAEAAVGSAVYMLPSFYNHDCDPNTHIIWIDNAEARLKAIRDIEEGEELRICYTDASMNAEARQTILTQGYGFRCQCLRCSSGD